MESVVPALVKMCIRDRFGFVMMIAGFVLAVSLPDAQGIMLALPYVCIGVGAGIFGGNLDVYKRQLTNHGLYVPMPYAIYHNDALIGFTLVVYQLSLIHIFFSSTGASLKKHRRPSLLNG